MAARFTSSPCRMERIDDAGFCRTRRAVPDDGWNGTKSFRAAAVARGSAGKAGGLCLAVQPADSKRPADAQDAPDRKSLRLSAKINHARRLRIDVIPWGMWLRSGVGRAGSRRSETGAGCTIPARPPIPTRTGIIRAASAGAHSSDGPERFAFRIGNVCRKPHPIAAIVPRRDSFCLAAFHDELAVKRCISEAAGDGNCPLGESLPP